MVDLDALGYRSGGSGRPLPDWVHYLAALGRFAVTHETPGRRLVVGVSVPTRSFAAAFCALGVTSAAYVDPEKRDPRAHFNWLAALPPKTALRYRHGTHLHCGELVGVALRSGDEYLAISGGYLRRWDMCGDIQPLEPGEEFIRRRTLSANPDFVAACMPGVDPLVHACYTSLDCLIVGVKDALRREILDQQFLAPVSGSPAHMGVLNDLLRCDAFEANANDHDRTSVLSAFADEVPARLLSSRPPAVVFDGGPGFLRLRSHWRASPWIVVVDRSLASAQAAGDAFNQELAMSIDDADVSSAGEAPAGLEVRAYYEVAR